ncbi:MAG: glycosyltransferase [Geobacteraceae bacterium]|nr:glycosyltransferase [Geobacteraceae bacterium]MDD3024849.1 glycosyltransferase [Syntrophomonadaceae bacterium]
MIFATADFPVGPATTSRIKLISKILKEGGHNVTLAIFHANTKNMIPENLQIEGNYENITYRYLNGKTVRPSKFTKAVFDSLRGLVNALWYLRTKKKLGRVDAVIFYTPDLLMTLPCVVFSKILRLPMILELCEIFSSSDDKLLKHRIKRFGSIITDKILPKMCSGVIVISTQILEFVTNNNISLSKIFHLPILVDFDKFSIRSKDSVHELTGKKYFLNSGTLEDKDGIEYILKAFLSISKTYDDLYLVFTGGAHPDRKKLVVDSAIKFNLENRIIFTGFIPESQLIWSYQNATALLCCRSNKKFTNYGFPTKLAEYLASGKPVITTYVGDVKLYLKDRHSAFIAEPENSQSIRECMELILIDPDLALLVGAAGKRVALNCFDYRKFIDPVDKYLKTVIRY